MNIFIVTVGSRGDVQPYIALGKGLKAAGHAVTICTCSSFESFITGNGLNYGYMNDEFIKLVDSAEGRDAIESGGKTSGLIKSMLTLMKKSKEINRSMMRDAWEAAQEVKPDLVLFHPKAIAGPHIAEKLGIPVVLAVPVPVIVPTAEAPAIGFPRARLGAWYNKLTFSLLHKGYHAYDDVVNEFRREILGLGILPKSTNPLHTTDGKPIPVLHGYSEYVSPRPADWPDTAHITGYWFLDQEEGWQPPEKLAAFLAAGAAPVYAGFGSMAGRKPQHMAEIVTEALQQAKLRGIIASGWGGLEAGKLPDTILKIDKAPHSWLFPRMAAVVHHGGAGTTAAGLRAGCPTIICPFLIDQPYWGEQVYALGAGTKPIPRKKLTAENLAAALREAVSNPAIREKAEAIGRKLKDENGIAKAIAIIENIALIRQNPGSS